MKKIIYSYIVLMIVATVGLAARPVGAVDYLLENIRCLPAGDCTLCDLVQVGLNLSDIIVAVSGVMVWVMFFYGGLMWLISYGDNKKIQQGKDIIKAAVIGLFIIFFAWTAISLIQTALSVKKVGDNPSNWWIIPNCPNYQVKAVAPGGGTVSPVNPGGTGNGGVVDYPVH